MKQYIKDGIIKYANRIVIRTTDAQIFNPTEEMILADGWVEYVEPSEEEVAKQREASRLRRSLSTTDYKVIKCMEAYLCGEELPYDIEALHAERNAQRAEINILEA